MTASLSRRTLVQTAAGVAGATAISLKYSGAIAQTDLTGTPEAPAPIPGEALVTMSPQHGTRFALPDTTLAFRGVTAEEVGHIIVTGSGSGPASGIVRDHSDGGGFSWIPDVPFFETETITVTAETPLTTNEDGSAVFEICNRGFRPSTDVQVTEDPVDETVIHAFKSRPDLAPVQVDVYLNDEDRVAPGLVAVTPHIPNGQAGATIYDNNGQPVWHHVAADPNHPSYCLQMQEYEGQPVLTWSEGAKKQGYGYNHFVIADQTYTPIAYVQAGHGVDGLDVHDMVISPYGTAWAFSYNAVWTDDEGTPRNVLETVIQEIDISTGDVWWEWHSLDHIPLDASFTPRPEDPDNAWDNVHTNSIEIDYDGNLLISSRAHHAIYRINTANHQLIWTLGGKYSDFPIEPDALFHWQHDARRLEDGTVSIFDNVDSDNEVDSRGLVFELDEDAMTATLIREYHRDGGMHSPYQANMQTLENGNVFIGWGSGPRCSEFTHEGEMIYDMRYKAGVSYRGYRVEWSGFPDRPIDYLLEDAADGSLTCFVSWNGATDVAEWRVITDAAGEVARVAKEGFESELTGIPVAAYMEVQALNAAGNILGGRVLHWVG